MPNPIIRLNSEQDLSIFWENMPEGCVEVQKQYNGDWVGNYDNSVLLICKDIKGNIIKGIDEKDLPFELDWNGVPMDNKYGVTPTLLK